MSGIEIATAYVSLVSSAKGLGQSITGELDAATGAADAAGNKAGSKFGGAFGKAASLIGTVGVGAFLADSVKSLSNIESINAQTASAIQTTGGAAQVTSQHVQDLALSLESMSAQEREGIQSGANFLLTFKNIKNGVGAGNDIFDQTTQAMVDLSVATGTDMQGAALQLGKALNDPIAGVGALSRVGVTFTAQQKDQIKAMQTAGDTAGAQKVILAELNSEFGGSGAAAAKTFAGRMYFLTDAIGGVGEAIVGKAMGPLGGLAEMGTKVANAAADWITNFSLAKGSLGEVGTVATQVFSILGKGDFTGLAALQEDSPLVKGLFLIRQGAQDAGGALKILATGDFTGLNFFQEDSPFVNGLLSAREHVIGLGTSIKTDLTGAFQKAKPALAGAFDAMKPALATIGTSLMDTLSTTFAQIGPVLTSVLQVVGPVISNLMSGLAPVFAQLGPVIGQLLPLLNPVGFLLKSLLPILPQLADAFGQIAVAISGALGQALKAIAPLLPVIAGVFTQIVSVLAQGLVQAVLALVPVVLTLAGAFTAILPTIVTLVQSLLPPLMSLFQSLVPLITSIVAAVVPLVQTLANMLIPAINALLPVVQLVFGFIADTIKSVMEIVQGVIEVVTGIITGNWTLVWQGIKDIFIGIWDNIKARLDYVLGLIGLALGAAWEGIKSAASLAWGLIHDYIVTPLQKAWDWVTTEFLKVVGWIDTHIWTPIKTATETAWKWVYDKIIGPILDAYNWVKGKLTDLKDWVTGIWNDITGIFSKTLTANVDISGNYVATGTSDTLQATGGVWQPRPGGHRVIVGEGGQQEIVSPTPLLKSIVNDAFDAHTGIGLSGAQVIHITVNNEGPELSPEAVNEGLKAWERRYGYAL